MALDLGGRLSTAQLDLIDDVLARRNGELRARLQLHTVSRSDAEQIVNALGDELTAHLDDHWEPTEHGRLVSEILAYVNAHRIAEWP